VQNIVHLVSSFDVNTELKICYILRLNHANRNEVKMCWTIWN